MKLTTVFLLLSLFTLGNGQTPRKRGAQKPPPPKPTAAAQTAQPSPPASVTAQPSRPVPLVVVIGQTITTADIDPSARAEADSVDERITAARNQVLDVQINTLLLEIEARRRRSTSQQIYDQEVTRRISDPAEAEINTFVEQNRDQLPQGSELRTRVIALLKSQKEAKLSDTLVRSLRTTVPVVMGADINTPGLNHTAVVATVGGQPITAGILNERLKPIIYNLQLAAYEVQRQAAEQVVDDILLLAEANRRNIGPEEIVRTEVSQKLQAPTEAEVSKFYTENREHINGPLDEVRNQVALYLQDEQQRRLERALSERLRKGVEIRWLITEPAPPVHLISVADDPSRGAPNAPVTIVEFTDFQCPACAAMHPVLEDVLKNYGDKVRFVVRDFPLPIHANAKKAAEAANAAHAQGKFFEYAALLFKRQDALDVASLKKYATELGLNRTKFDAALDSGMYAVEVRRDMQDGEIYGIDSTPTIFINGVRLRTLSAEALRESIDNALARSQPTTPPAKP